jgi:recombination protein RecT
MATPMRAITVMDDLQRPEIIHSFADVLGSEAQANSYIQSVLILVATDLKLAECTPVSVFKSALRAASLGLSCDPATKQAWLIPYSKNIGTREKPQWVKEAQFQPHYLGLYSLAMRTGKYWVINVSPVYEGQRVLENPLTGLHSVKESGGFVGEPKAYNPAYTALVDVTERRTKDLKVIGWIGYFKAKKGNEKSVWMSIADIEDHALKFVKEYQNNQNWKDPDKRRTMEMKTVLRRLLAWADLSGSENAKLAEALQNDPDYEAAETVEATAEEVTTEQPVTESAAEAVEMVNPFDKGPIAHAANAWNVAPAQVRKEIDKAILSGKLTNPMPKADFKAWVANPQGEPQPA